MTKKHLHRTAIAPITPSDEGILCHESVVLDRIDNRTVAAVKDIDLPPLPKATFGSPSTGRVSTIKMPRRSPAKAKSSVSSRWCWALIFAGQGGESRDPRFVPGQDVILTGGASKETTGVARRHRGLR